MNAGRELRLLVTISWSGHHPTQGGLCTVKMNSRDLGLSALSSVVFNNSYVFLVDSGPSLLCAGSLSLGRAWAALHCGVWASDHSCFSCCEAQAPGAKASVVAACGLRSCSVPALLPHDVWTLPGPGITPVSSALAGSFLSPAMPGRSLVSFWHPGCFPAASFSL